MSSSYFKEIKKSMSLISKRKNSIFLGQSVAVPGNLLFKSLKHINKSKKLELPVFEETQMGMAIGMSLNGFLPITCYPRYDFFILSLNQTINHLDKINATSSGNFKPFVLIRVLVGSKKPIDAGPQHSQNYSSALKKMITQIKLVDLKNKNNVFKEYKKALKNKQTTIFVEYSEKY